MNEYEKSALRSSPNTRSALVPMTAGDYREPLALHQESSDDLVNQLVGGLVQVDRQDPNMTGTFAEATANRLGRTYSIDDEEIDEPPVPIPTIWRGDSPAEETSWYAEQLRASAYGFVIGLFVVIPAVLLLTGQAERLPSWTSVQDTDDKPNSSRIVASRHDTEPQIATLSVRTTTIETRAPSARDQRLDGKRTIEASSSRLGQPVHFVQTDDGASRRLTTDISSTRSLPTNRAPQSAPQPPRHQERIQQTSKVGNVSRDTLKAGQAPTVANKSIPISEKASMGIPRFHTADLVGQEKLTTDRPSTGSFSRVGSSANTKPKRSDAPEAGHARSAQIQTTGPNNTAADLEAHTRVVEVSPTTSALLRAPTLESHSVASGPRDAVRRVTDQDQHNRTASMRIETSPGISSQATTTRSPGTIHLPNSHSQQSRSTALAATSTPDTVVVARELIANDDVTRARIVLARLASQGNADAVFLLAETFDPNVLAAWGKDGQVADPDKARMFYSMALSEGVTAAQSRLSSLSQ
ncbi:MAG: hypothetical protein ACR2PG_10765 [Hyphomicrobiaceae bacterium]